MVTILTTFNVLKLVGCSVAVNDAHPIAKAASRIILTASSGTVTIRKLCDLIALREESMATE